jgi:hypothetical protein
MTTAELVRTRVDNSHAGSFIRSSDLPGPRSAVLTALSRLHAEGELVRVRNGLYWKGVTSRYGPGRPGLLDAAVKMAGDRGVGPAGWSATHVLGLSTQLPAMPEVAVTGPAPTLDGVRFHRRNNVARHDLRFIEIALMEVLRDFPRHSEVDIEEVARMVRRLEQEGKLRFSKVEKAASSEHSPALRRNLEVIRELLDADLAAA